MRKLLPLILILGFIIPIQPANAIFGLSKCEKVIKSLNKEQQVGLAQWEYANKRIKIALEPINYGNIDYAKDVVNMWILVSQSDLNIYKNIEKNANCFKPQEVAENRYAIAEAQRSIKTLSQTWISYLNNLNTKLVSEVNYKNIMEMYPNFYDWKTGKKINK